MTTLSQHPPRVPDNTDEQMCSTPYLLSLLALMVFFMLVVSWFSPSLMSTNIDIPAAVATAVDNAVENTTNLLAGP